MKIILREKIPGVGEKGEEKEVADGYARNYLIPKNLAFPATSQNIKKLELEIRLKEQAKKKELRSAKKLAQKLEKVSFTIRRKVGEEEKMFGSVTSDDIAGLLKQEGFNFDKRDILLERPIQELGVYQIPVKLHPEVHTQVKVWIVKE